MTEVEKRLNLLTKNMAILDQALSDQPYVAGPHFSMADIPLGLAAFRWFNLEIDRPSMPHVEAWYERLASRPAMRPHLTLPMT